MASEAYENILNDIDTDNNYNTLAKCTLALLLVFNRRRIGEVQFLDFDTYERPTVNVNQEEILSCLTEFEKTLCNTFKRVVVFGKGSKPVPILFTKKTQKYTDMLIEIRRKTNLVPKENKYIFATSGSTRWISGSAVISKLASACGAKQPKLLTSTRFRKQIATILQLMSFENDELYQVAKFMVHTEKTHMEYYRLTESTYQTAKVAKILLLLESGRGAEFKGKALNEITLDNDFLDDEVEDSQQPENEADIITYENPQPGSSGTQEKVSKGKALIYSDITINSSKTTSSEVKTTLETKRFFSKKSISDNEVRQEISIESNSSGIQEDVAKEKKMKLTNIKGRVKWEPHQKNIVLKAFKKTHKK
ncbi:hypothetical protein NQ314_017700 [Rhamnusium bicolor]|uniref:Tyr recombinase domain-containing protein n=1 Tax=Rhamnusium bicolor TaxID=1586634 RepID=A0AAV8WSV9_9CUCU|nr:hypothetical protein NQ314_017700 [Rhamnusium bicolor]